MARYRRTGSRNWTRGLFATFWILLGGLSGAYLFTALTNPTALGGQLVSLNAGGTAPASDGTTAAIGTSGSSDRELAEIKATLRELSEQMAALTAKVGPVAALPSDARSETPPATETKTPEAAAAPPAPPPAEPPAEEVKPAPAEETKPAEAPKEEPKPVEQAAVTPAEEIKPAPATPSEPPPVAVSPLEEDAPEGGAMPAAETPPPAPPVAVQEAPASPPQAAATPAPASPAAETPAPAPPAATESAALDPIALPPAANDGSTRYGIEIGTVAKQDALRPLWREFLTNHAALVAGLQPRRVLAPDKKWRLIAGPFGSADEASQACALFKKASRPCEATVYAGDAL
jgi:sporulation related protein